MPQEYKVWLSELKSKIRSSQIKAVITVNAVLIQFYWELGQMITNFKHILQDPASDLAQQTLKDPY